jgi:hypothetical protein
MNYKLLTALLLTALVRPVVASTWYVNGVTGSNSNNCTSPTTACKTIKHAISLAASGDSILAGSATYTENLTIGKSLTIIGSGASTTIIDGGGINTVVIISSSSASVTLSKLTIRHGHASSLSVGGGINNKGTLKVNAVKVMGNSACSGAGSVFGRCKLFANLTAFSFTRKETARAELTH